jgi:biopolymer transport protein ExbD
VLLHQIDVEVTRDNGLTIDQSPVAWAALYDVMAAAVKAHERRGHSKHVALYADANARYDAIIKVLDAARAAGDEDVGFVTY